jgi:hypothetical protein
MVGMWIPAFAGMTWEPVALGHTLIVLEAP